MSKDMLEEQLSKKKLFVVKYAIVIILFIVIAMSIILVKLRIGEESLLSSIVKYYT